jgi:cytochrome b
LGFFGLRPRAIFGFRLQAAEALAYLRDMIASRAKRYLGHSPGGAAMVFALLTLLAATVVTGLIVYGGEQQAGPLAGMFSKDTGEAVEEAHELLANSTLALVFFHLVGVALASFGHHENLVRAMITGYKRP